MSGNNNQHNPSGSPLWDFLLRELPNTVTPKITPQLLNIHLNLSAITPPQNVSPRLFNAYTLNNNKVDNNNVNTTSNNTVNNSNINNNHVSKAVKPAKKKVKKIGLQLDSLLEHDNQIENKNNTEMKTAINTVPLPNNIVNINNNNNNNINNVKNFPLLPTNDNDHNINNIMSPTVFFSPRLVSPGLNTMGINNFSPNIGALANKTPNKQITISADDTYAMFEKAQREILMSKLQLIQKKDTNDVFDGFVNNMRKNQNVVLLEQQSNLNNNINALQLQQLQLLRRADQFNTPATPQQLNLIQQQQALRQQTMMNNLAATNNFNHVNNNMNNNINITTTTNNNNNINNKRKLSEIKDKNNKPDEPSPVSMQRNRRRVISKLIQQLGGVCSDGMTRMGFQCKTGKVPISDTLLQASRYIELLKHEYKVLQDQNPAQKKVNINDNNEEPIRKKPKLAYGTKTYKEESLTYERLYADALTPWCITKLDTGELIQCNQYFHAICQLPTTGAALVPHFEAARSLAYSKELQDVVVTEFSGNLVSVAFLTSMKKEEPLLFTFLTEKLSLIGS